MIRLAIFVAVTAAHVAIVLLSGAGTQAEEQAAEQAGTPAGIPAGPIRLAIFSEQAAPSAQPSQPAQPAAQRAQPVAQPAAQASEQVAQIAEPSAQGASLHEEDGASGEQAAQPGSPEGEQGALAGGFGNGFYPQEMLSSPPRFDERAIAGALIFPRAALRAGIEGRVVLELFVDADGAVAFALIAREEPQGRGFGDAALKAFEGRRGIPATVDGRAAPARFRYPVVFKIM
ncbi:MAG: TonB family protein [Treponema sp.]|nr:TonB family protein [Treponema sp.]